MLTTFQIIEFLENSLHINQVVDPETSLFSTGILDSVAMLEVITYIEDKAAVTIRPDEVTLENFDTVSRIVNLISEKTSK